jgi:stress-induced morphogen
MVSPMSATEQAITSAIEQSIDGAKVQVRSGNGGHFELEVVSSAFDGVRTLERHRMVLNAIKELMAGDSAPVHAIDSIKTSTG